MKKRIQQKAAAPKQKPRHAFEMEDGHELLWPGSGNGFDKDGDRIRLSPGRLSAHEEMMAQLHGVNSLLEATNRYVAERHAEILRQRMRWWKEVAADLGINVDDEEYCRLTTDQNGCVRLRPKVEEQAELNSGMQDSPSENKPADG